MKPIRAEVSALLDAAPQAVYAVLADYRTAHAAILPRPYFQDLKVEQGGQGAGTVVEVRMQAMGTDRRFRFQVSEPEPGRTLVEQEPGGGACTTFRLEPLADGRQTRLTITTETPGKAGLWGWVERLVSRRFLEKVYGAELDNLAAYLKQAQGKPAA